MVAFNAAAEVRYRSPTVADLVQKIAGRTPKSRRSSREDQYRDRRELSAPIPAARRWIYDRKP